MHSLITIHLIDYYNNNYSSGIRRYATSSDERRMFQGFVGTVRRGLTLLDMPMSNFPHMGFCGRNVMSLIRA